MENGAEGRRHPVPESRGVSPSSSSDSQEFPVTVEPEESPTLCSLLAPSPEEVDALNEALPEGPALEATAAPLMQRQPVLSRLPCPTPHITTPFQRGCGVRAAAVAALSGRSAGADPLPYFAPSECSSSHFMLRRTPVPENVEEIRCQDGLGELLEV
jgi:hypothetical protein